MRIRRGLTNWILLALEKSVDGYVSFEDFIYHPYKHVYGYPGEIKKQTLSKALKFLRENGLVELISDQELAYRLTDTGKDQAVWSRLKIGNEKWDGKWRLVIFDIPERRRMARDLLRSKLKQWGFICWQKSVWASKKNCTKLLRDFIRQVGIEDWVMVIESDDVGR